MGAQNLCLEHICLGQLQVTLPTTDTAIPPAFERRTKIRCRVLNITLRSRSGLCHDCAIACEAGQDVCGVDVVPLHQGLAHFLGGAEPSDDADGQAVCRWGCGAVHRGQHPHQNEILVLHGSFKASSDPPRLLHGVIRCGSDQLPNTPHQDQHVAASHQHQQGSKVGEQGLQTVPEWARLLSGCLYDDDGSPHSRRRRHPHQTVQEPNAPQRLQALWRVAHQHDTGQHARRRQRHGALHAQEAYVSDQLPGDKSQRDAALGAGQVAGGIVFERKD
mmetsp:Transcript_48844/g.106350  ORF Transcript_48844/g.106350 Transcript_48844/m.106350 type:complete len:275 (-) Transcript_48844:734-1558(-)